MKVTKPEQLQTFGSIAITASSTACLSAATASLKAANLGCFQGIYFKIRYYGYMVKEKASILW